MQEAQDVWSLGVMAFELLTGTQAVLILDSMYKACHLAHVYILWSPCMYIVERETVCR